MYAFPRKERFLYYEELCMIFNDDSSWGMKPEDLLYLLMQIRQNRITVTHENRSLLGDLEDEYGIPRDNLNTILNKAFKQTGLFEYVLGGSRIVGLAISSETDSVLQRRIRFVLDHESFSDKEWSEHLQIRELDMPLEVTRLVAPAVSTVLASDLESIVTEFRNPHSKAGLIFNVELVQRFVASILSKRFLIATGLAGSGKTKIAQAFARWLSPSVECYAVVPVGADWIGNENVLGYPNGLDNETYISKPALDVILHAKDAPEIPHFLILDEMNLSHVERYFSDILSVIESDEEIRLYDGTDRKAGVRPIESRIELPKNLFIIGTVNVDETTYMFSPKVLDRANVIEFRMEAGELSDFLDNPAKPDLSKMNGKGVSFGKAFVEAAKNPVIVPDDIKTAYDAEMLVLFKTLQGHGAEFGYRTAYETARFMHFYEMLGKHAERGDWFPGALDCVVFQKLLPKLHGSRAKLGPVLKKLWYLCVTEHKVDLEDKGERDKRVEAVVKAANEAARSNDKKTEPTSDIPPGAPYPLSAEKISRMWQLLMDNGFASFAEA